jgi:Trp operon repressor
MSETEKDIHTATQTSAERQSDGSASQLLDESRAKLVKFGGFAILETTVEGVQNMNPDKKARKKIFLTENAKKSERAAVKSRLQILRNLLKETVSVAEAAQNCQQRAQQTRQLLNSNMLAALQATKELEKSYRSVALFFENTEADKVKNVSILNADSDQLRDLENTTFIDYVQEELVSNYDRLDLRNNYSILVIPGYLGSKQVIEKWAKIAYKNKVMLVTDFVHLDAPEDVLELFESANLTGGDAYLSNVMMTCNWLVGRGKQKEVGEEEDVYIPPSMALAGKVYTTLMSQVTAGRKHGALNNAQGVRFPLKKTEIANLEKIGLIPMVAEYGKVMAFSAKTLFNGDNLGLQTYSVVRVFDYVTKVLIDFLNRRAFENFNFNTQQEIQRQIARFLDNITGPGKLIEKFKILRFERDPKQKDRIFLDIHMTPYFPAKSFMIKLDGTKGDDPDSAEWKSEYAQN